MSEPHYNIIFRGDIVFGSTVADVKLALQQLFKTDENKINALFTGKPVVLKRNLDAADSEKYKQALLKAGARVDLVVADNESDPSAVRPEASPPPASPVKTGNSAAVWSLAPAGSDLLTKAERVAEAAPAVAVGDFSLRPVGVNLLDQSEQPPVDIARVEIPAFALADVGADLLQPGERRQVSTADVDVTLFELAELGSDLIEDDEKEIVLPAIISIPDVGLAPVGSDLGQIKSVTKPVVPDISKIHLVD